MRVESQLLRNFVCGGAVASLTLTFFDPVMWSAVGLFLGLGLLLLVPVAMSRAHTEPPEFFFALAWIVTAGLLAFAYGATQEFYNIRQVGFLLIGLVVGFLISLVRVPQWAAWTPFGLLALYFGGLAILGRDPADSLTQNSRNYVSVMLLAMFASAMLLSKPMTVRPLHVVMALIVLTISIWGTGRAGILCALLLTGGLSACLLFQGRLGVLRATLSVIVLCVLAVAVFVGVEILQTQGYLDRFASRGFRDAPRLSIIVSYFYQIEPAQLFFGKNYYHDPFMEKWGYNLHNSYLSAWAHLGLYYFAVVLAAVAICVRRLRKHPAIVIAVLAFAVRALTDTHLFGGQYDYIALAALFIFLRDTPAGAIKRSPATLRS
jgi:hypothetical protein